MKIDLDFIFLTMEGDSLKNPESKAPLTMKQACVGALLGNYRDEQNLSGEEKSKRFELAMDMQMAKGEFNLKTEDAALLKKLIGKQWSTLVCGQAYRVIEGQMSILPKKTGKENIN